MSTNKIISLLEEMIELDEMSVCEIIKDKRITGSVMKDLQNKMQELTERRSIQIKKILSILKKDNKNLMLYDGSMIISKILQNNTITISKEFLKEWDLKTGDYLGIPQMRNKIVIISIVQPTITNLKKMKQID